ncbi:MAG: CoA-binding protein [Syntrophales bacterium]|nr:CoA-binding protein [Syntrophales bacterium]
MREKLLDLSKFFFPQSLALMGVSQKSGGLGGRSFLEKYLIAGYKGKIYLIHPQVQEIMGIRTYPKLSSLPQAPDLTMIALPANQIPLALKECAQIGARYIHILSAGFSETGSHEGMMLEKQLKEIAEEHDLLIIGPNCMGPYCPSSHLTAWGAIPGKSGPLGIISQSGGITQRLTEYACSLGVGTSKAVSIGNATCLDVTDFLSYLGEDEATAIIALYLEGTNDGRRLLTLARHISSRKPIVILKGGESHRGAQTVSSHTGQMAGNYEIWKAFFRQTNSIAVTNINEWMDVILALCLLPPARGDGVFIVGGGGGNSIIHTDICVRTGLTVPRPKSATMEKLKQLVPATGSIAGNPLDYWEAYLRADRLCLLLDIAYEDSTIHLVIVDRLIPRQAYHSPEVEDYVQEVAHYIKSHPKRKPTVFTIDYDGGDRELLEKGATLRHRFCTAEIPAYPSFERAASALSHFARYHLTLTERGKPLY